MSNNFLVWRILKTSGSFFAGLLGLVMIFGNVPQARAQSVFRAWQPNAYQYDNGFNPSIAISGSTVVEVHNGGGAAGPLWYHIGTLVGYNGYSTIQWQPNAYQYDNGFNPSIAISGSTVVEVHNGGGAAGPLWYHIGTLVGSTIQWQPNAYQYDNGFNPSIAISGSTVVEVHNGSGIAGPMWYHLGNVVSGTPYIIWQNSIQYDSGWNPKVAFQYYGDLIEVHNSGTAIGPMWFHNGKLGSTKTINWSQSQQYDYGFNPSVASGINSQFSTVEEVHNGTNGSGPLWYHLGWYEYLK